LLVLLAVVFAILAVLVVRLNLVADVDHAAGPLGVSAAAYVGSV
jgi:hypothetical protein